VDSNGALVLKIQVGRTVTGHGRAGLSHLRLPAAYAPREGDAHPSGVEPASVRLSELHVAAIAAAIDRGPNKAEAVASGHAAVAGGAAVIGECGGAGGAAAGRAGASRRAR